MTSKDETLKHYTILTVLVDNQDRRAGLLFASAWKKFNLSAEFEATSPAERELVSVTRVGKLVSALPLPLVSDPALGVSYVRQTGNDAKLRVVVLAGVRQLVALNKLYLPIRLPFPVIRDQYSHMNIMQEVIKY